MFQSRDYLMAGWWVQHGENPECRKFFTYEDLHATIDWGDMLSQWLDEIHNPVPMRWMSVEAGRIEVV